MAVKKRSLNGKGSYAAYKNAGSYSKNKTRAIKRHLASNPGDEQAKVALKSVGVKSSRNGYVGAVNPGSALNIANGDRLMSQMKAAVRRAERVYKTVKNKDSMVFGGKIWTKEQMKAEFKFVQHKPRDEATPATPKKKVRRGK